MGRPAVSRPAHHRCQLQVVSGLLEENEKTLWPWFRYFKASMGSVHSSGRNRMRRFPLCLSSLRTF